MSNKRNIGLGIVGIIGVIVIVFTFMFGIPKYKVWQQEMEGKAQLAKAEQNRQILIQEAKANLEAEILNAQAEVERAKGAAKAIEIENGCITPTYIQYLWVRQQKNFEGKTIIYVPSSEMGIPIMEANRLKNE